MAKKGNLSINSDNILPIIKKWLYSDSDIFIRELVSNATDAITKYKKLVAMGDAGAAVKDEKYAIHVKIDKENKIITIEDNGLGMTEDEIEEYINQIAFSGANAFMEKYKDKMDQSGEIIGHFGLGFYSAFMVADTVQIDTLSYQEGASPARWRCDGGIEYEMSEGDRKERGTVITLYVSEEGQQFLDEYKFSSILKKYCGFIPVDIYFEAVKADAEDKSDIIDVVDDGNEEDKKEDKKEKTKEEKTQEKPEPKPINDTNPLWMKPANECTDDEYKEFYHKVFSDFNDPLFWIHLNMDYPFRLKGILYFPKLKHELESIEGQVKLYNNQVFIADNIKEVIPEFLLLLKGVMDCPDLPLNVSRSFLQNDGYVTKMSGYISKKVADKLNSIFKKDRESFNGYWDDISPFIKYGCIKEKDFYDKVKGSVLFKTINGEYVTKDEFIEKNKDKTENQIFYVTNEQLQAQYIKMFRDEGMDAVVLTTNLDNPFISYLESYESEVKFNRIDSDLSKTLKDTDDEADTALDEEMGKVFKEVLAKENLKVKVEGLKSESVCAIALQSEQARRMEEMSKMFGGGLGMGGMFANEESLVLNKNHSLVKLLLNIKDDESKKDSLNLVCEQVYDLAMMSHRPFDTDEMSKFIERSNKILEMAINVK